MLFLSWADRSNFNTHKTCLKCCINNERPTGQKQQLLDGRTVENKDKLGWIDQPSTTYLVFSTLQILEKTWQKNEVCQLFIYFKKAYDYIRRESFYDILIAIFYYFLIYLFIINLFIHFGLPKQLVNQSMFRGNSE